MNVGDLRKALEGLPEGAFGYIWLPALGIIAVQFNADLGMVIIASLWGIWHIVSGMTLAVVWRRLDARPAD